MQSRKNDISQSISSGKERAKTSVMGSTTTTFLEKLLKLTVGEQAKAVGGEAEFVEFVKAVKVVGEKKGEKGSSSHAITSFPSAMVQNQLQVEIKGAMLPGSWMRCSLPCGNSNQSANCYIFPLVDISQIPFSQITIALFSLAAMKKV